MRKGKLDFSLKWFVECMLASLPENTGGSVADWAERHVRLPGSARSERFDPRITPWIVEPLEMATGGRCRSVTFVKPVQCGGSVAGEVAILYWIATGQSGDIYYNWEDSDKATDRWDKRFERVLKACGPAMDRAPEQARHAGKWSKCKVLFPHANFVMQGVWSPENLDSESVRFEVNEEIHSWKPGRLAKAYNRMTAVWNGIAFNISNAGVTGDQLWQRFEQGTKQQWEVQCPGCGLYHRMRTAWDAKRPELGGLRYDADGCRLEDGSYDYKRLVVTVRYQMPCGYEVRNTKHARRALSQSGRYGPPQNEGALLTERSYTLDAVAVDYIPWIDLIQEKHTALAALRRGDAEPWKRYLTERECRFWDPEERPLIGAVTLNFALKKNRAGLPNRVVRFGALDRQQGSIRRGETPHWWGVIRDVDAVGNSLLVWEGKLKTDEEAADVMRRHGVKPQCVAVDSGDDTMHVYQFCLAHGFNAIKGEDDENFAHPDGSRRIFSPERPLHVMLGCPATTEDVSAMPLFWLYSKFGIRDRLDWLRSAPGVQWETPGDVSDDYKAHMEAEELQERKHARTGEIVRQYVQIKKRNDLLVCEAYICCLMDMAGLIGFRK